jgi:hypothetical protein
MKFQCPNCQKSLNVSDKYLGKRGKCRGCGAVFLVEVLRPSPEPSGRAGRTPDHRPSGKPTQETDSPMAACANLEAQTGEAAEIRRQRPSLAECVRLPNLSGTASAAWLACCLLLTGALIPVALRLPCWVEFEIVLACWWTIWLVVLTWLLATGVRVSDDYRFRETRNWFGSRDRSEGIWGGMSWLDGLLFVPDFEGCGAFVAVICGLLLLVGAIWFLFEVAVPVVLFLLYFLVRGMLAQVVNDRHDCRGHLARALAWGMLWATVYTAPLAGAVWFIHHVHRSRGG